MKMWTRDMSMGGAAVCAGAAAVLFVNAGAMAGIVEYFGSKTEWLAALGQPVDFMEDFEGFLVDTSFRTAPVAANGFSLEQTGSNAYDFRNIIDVPPFLFGDNNGTNHASMYVNQDVGAGAPGTFVELTPDLPVVAWGAHFTSAGGSELVDITLHFSAGGSVTFSPAFTPSGVDEFWGFIATSPATQAVSVIEFTARIYINDPAGEGFTMDNVQGVFIPSPPALALLGLAGLMGARRRRR